MSSKNPSQVNHETARRSSLGTLLRTTRQERNFSLDETAATTRISERILTALESDDFATLPAEVFTRGFIKIYAEYLGLDPNEVLKLFTDQENLDPERPADRPYRRDILFGTAMAHPLQVFKGNPRLRIIAMLLAALLGFYALGAVIKSFQKHPGQDSPENEVAKSLVNGQPPNLPGPPGVPVAPLDAKSLLTAINNQAKQEAQTAAVPEETATTAPAGQSTQVTTNSGGANQAQPTTTSSPAAGGERASRRPRPEGNAASAPASADQTPQSEASSGQTAPVATPAH